MLLKDFKQLFNIIDYKLLTDQFFGGSYFGVNRA